jgi:hypothetical protein
MLAPNAIRVSQMVVWLAAVDVAFSEAERASYHLNEGIVVFSVINELLY